MSDVPPGDLEALETALLGAPCALTRDEVAEQAGVGEPEARAFWTALGFPEVAEGERAFTALDVEALRTVQELAGVGVVEPATLLVLARAMGQGLARLAEAQVDAFNGQAARLSFDEATEQVLATAPEVLPRLETLVLHVWRRQLAAATARALVAPRQDGQPLLAVGFVDLVDFTRSTRSWDSATLERTLERFERDTALRVTRVGGRVVKTLGDEVLFVTDDALSAVEVGLDTVAAHEDDADLPQVRAGLALGGVLVRLGDVFGSPVNLASRLTDQARPGSVLVDDALAAELAGDPSYDVKALRRRSVRGYKHLVPHLVRRVSVRP